MSEADLTMQGHGHAPALTLGPVFSIPTKKLAMWLFIIADTMTFAACLVAYGFLRNGTPNWPRPFHSITNVAIMTFVLLTSSLTMLIGLRAAKAGDKATAFLWTMITAALGMVFALLHINEWVGLVGEGMTMFKNPWGTGFWIRKASIFPTTSPPLTTSPKSEYDGGRPTPSGPLTTKNWLPLVLGPALAMATDPTRYFPGAGSSSAYL